ncbi:C40 family peptidase [Segeticoccus rhizosphaerae]|uniref:C40 family peptidase n=2 Tax=Segeticoccus rhizosphaerae TaxID=1104777 RepID=UPI0010C104D6|nr:peptidoglycan-binding protein [Ornithinicoccus soli]
MKKQSRRLGLATVGAMFTGAAFGAPAATAAPTPAAAPTPNAAPVAAAAHVATAVHIATAVPTTPSVWQTVRYGARGAVVKQIQRIVGAYADGIFGPKTLAAVKRWQGSHGLVVDGIIGPKTAAKMRLSSGSSGGSTAPVSTSGYGAWQNVRYGARGAVVKDIQRVVGAYADGVFGPKTLSAVKSWQGSHGLLRDGVVGPKTAAAMRLDPAASTSRTSDAPSRDTDRTSVRDRVIDTAAAYTGIMYQWGGTSPSTGFDCSGYVQFVLGKVGISAPRTTYAQLTHFAPTSNPQPGDLVFIGTGHVGIYAGGGMMYDSGKPGIPTQKRRIFSGVIRYRSVI